MNVTELVQCFVSSCIAELDSVSTKCNSDGTEEMIIECLENGLLLPSREKRRDGWNLERNIVPLSSEVGESLALNDVLSRLLCVPPCMFIDSLFTRFVLYVAAISFAFTWFLLIASSPSFYVYQFVSFIIY